MFHCFVFVQILSGPLPDLFVSPVSPNLPDLFHCFVLWSSLSIACCLSLYLFAVMFDAYLSYIVHEVRSVRERERDTEREKQTERERETEVTSPLSR